MAERTGRIVAVDENRVRARTDEGRPMPGARPAYAFKRDLSPEPTECPKCGADLDDGECEECERSAPLDFDQ